MLGEFSSFIVWSYAIFFAALALLAIWLIVQNRLVKRRLSNLQQDQPDGR